MSLVNSHIYLILAIFISEQTVSSSSEAIKLYIESGCNDMLRLKLVFYFKTTHREYENLTKSEKQNCRKRYYEALAVVICLIMIAALPPLALLAVIIYSLVVNRRNNHRI
ncbi:MAG: hypothetical protein MHMPM18_003925 [Marteilia pararefringens]